jgi:hypothetical protein
MKSEKKSAEALSHRILGLSKAARDLLSRVRARHLGGWQASICIGRMLPGYNSSMEWATQGLPRGRVQDEDSSKVEVKVQIEVRRKV